MAAGLRVDSALVARGLFPSRAKATEAITAGLVQVDGRTVAKPSEIIGADASLAAQAPYPWVSRGGVKLAAALDRFGIDPSGRRCLDVGASTGGFSDVLLARGARHVLAIDVGHGQLHPRLRNDVRVKCLEKTDARKLSAADMPEAPSLIVADVSFISLSLVLPGILPLAAQAAHLVALVKPQFEGLSRNKNGIVRDDAERRAALDRIVDCVGTLGWHVVGHMDSPIMGGDGNREWLLHATLGAR